MGALISLGIVLEFAVEAFVVGSCAYLGEYVVEEIYEERLRKKEKAHRKKKKGHGKRRR